MASIFYEPKYLEIQNHSKEVIHETDDFYVVFSIKNFRAVSLPRGLFGSVVKKNRLAGFEDFQSFWNETIEKLQKLKVKTIELIHPIEIYKGYIKESWLGGVGFSIMYQDVNHHIPLRHHKLHQMEERKLKKILTKNYSFSQTNRNDFGKVYEFLAQCRAEKDLTLNINKFKLGRLFMTFPDRYDLFVGKLDGQMTCAAITLKSALNTAYYFLPGTLEAYKKDSPMVGLLHIIVDQLKGKYRYLDLGISSIEGNPQEGLITFKERMGGVRTTKARYYLKI